eukprot:6173588-Alexandrium_andersonii.AAC.1
MLQRAPPVHVDPSGGGPPKWPGTRRSQRPRAPERSPPRPAKGNGARCLGAGGGSVRAGRGPPSLP